MYPGKLNDNTGFIKLRLQECVPSSKRWHHLGSDLDNNLYIHILDKKIMFPNK